MLSTNFLIHLTLIEDIGPHVIQKIMQSQRSDVQTSDLYHLSASGWMQHFGLSANTAAKIVAGLADSAILEKELELIEKHKVQLVTIIDEAYPSLLKEIHLPPVVLYFWGSSFDNNPSIHAFGALRANGYGINLNKDLITSGDEKLNKDTSSSYCNDSFSVRPECAEGVYRRVEKNKALAIVGARKANEYGKRAVEALVPDLVAAGYTIVSGGALGIDTMAHEAALACGGKTIAILGSGLLKPYPSTNKKLFTSIVENGGIVASSYPLMMEPLPGNFPARNRIVTGLSQGCVVIQAAKKSGALISAHCALEQGREVFAVPGLFDDELSAGCHEIMQQGAKLVMSSADILSEFGESVVQIDKQVFQQQALFTDKSDLISRARPEFVEGGLRALEETLQHVQGERIKDVAVIYSAAQQKIIAACKQPASLEDIINSTHLSFEQIQSELFNLQLDGVVSQDFTGMWIVC